MFSFSLEPSKLRRFSINQLLLLTAIFIVAVDNNALFIMLWKALGDNPLNHLLFAASFVLFVLALTLIVLSLFSFNKTIKPALIIFILAASIISYYIDNLHVVFSVSMLQNIFETNVREATDLMNAGIFIHLVLFGILPSLLIAYVNIEKKSATSELLSRLKFLSVLFLVTTLSIIWTSKDYAFVLRENRSIRYLVNPVFPVVSLYKYIRNNVTTKDRSLVPVFEDAAKLVSVKASAKKDILVIVVGETARAQNFSLNGYARNTNPLLSQRDIINFKNTSSCGTATAESVPCMFSDLVKDNFSVADARHRENLLDGFKHAGFDVLWRDNNSSCKGVCARVENETLLDLDVKDLCNDNGCFDEILLYKLDEYVSQLQHDAVIVLHQMGSHGPAYYKRYPERFAINKPECNDQSVHNCTHDEIVNSYDNTILYSDYFLSRVIDYLQARSESYNTAMIYMSDHGESLGENGVYLHGLPYFMAPEEQTHVPFIVWLSDGMKQQRHIDTQCLKSNSEHAFSHDNLMHSALGLMGVSSAVYESEKDIFSSCHRSGLVESPLPQSSGSS